MRAEPEPVTDIEGARVLAKLGDSVTTTTSRRRARSSATRPPGGLPAEHGVEPREFNSYGSRRGNHEVMVRGTFANIRLRNQLAPGTEGGVTRKLPEGDETTIYEASAQYLAAGVRSSSGRQGVRLGLVARLGGQGHEPARRPRGHRQLVRAHPPLEPRRAWACCRCRSRTTT
jgi:hypothetical protein